MTRKTRQAPPPAGGEAPEPQDASGKAGEAGAEPREDSRSLVSELAEMKDRYLRAVADFDNYRKRMAREREEITCLANERLITDLLPVIDNLERAVHNAESFPGGEAVAEGIHLIGRQLRDVLSRCGLEKLPTIGIPFDPNLHEAVAMIPSGEHPEGTVVEEVRKGYAIKGKVLRPSQVTVSKGAPGTDRTAGSSAEAHAQSRTRTRDEGEDPSAEVQPRTRTRDEGKDLSAEVQPRTRTRDEGG